MNVIRPPAPDVVATSSPCFIVPKHSTSFHPARFYHVSRLQQFCMAVYKYPTRIALAHPPNRTSDFYGLSLIIGCRIASALIISRYARGVIFNRSVPFPRVIQNLPPTRNENCFRVCCCGVCFRSMYPPKIALYDVCLVLQVVFVNFLMAFSANGD